MSDNIFQRIFQPSGRGKLWWIFTIIIILAIAAFSVDFGSQYNKVIDKYQWKLPHAKEINFSLGLDLQGGSQLIYEADVSAIEPKDRAMSVEGARDVIERRVNFFGVSEPNVQINHTSDGDYRILVELAGIKDIKEAIKKIGETPLLEFKEQNNEIKQMTDVQTQEMNAYNNAAASEANKVLKELQSGKDFTADQSENLDWISESSDATVFGFVKNMEVGKISQKVEQDGDGFVIYKLIDKQNKQANGQPVKEVKASHLLICYKDISGCESGLTKQEAEDKIKELKTKATSENFAELVKTNSTEPGAKDRYGDLGWFGTGAMVKPFNDAVFAQATGTISDVVETDFGFHLIYKQEEREVTEYNVGRIFFDTKTAEDILGPQDQWKNTQLSGKNLKRATVQFNPNDNSPEIGLEFDEEGSKLFEEITDRNVGKPVAIFLDSYPISVPNVNEKITGGKAVISGKFTLPEAKKLVRELNSGALPVPIKLINQQTVGASLGQQSVDDSLQAALWGLLLIALFMIAYYRLPGLLSVFSLAIYGLIVLAIFKLWPVTISLAGVAGFVLSIGMAVDANVLIFERLKEELRAGRSLSKAIDEGFSRAWTSIRDGNFTTIIVCLVLMYFSSSVIKGFAITLFFGVMISMFTAIIVTRNLLKLIDERWMEKHKWLLGVREKKAKPEVEHRENLNL